MEAPNEKTVVGANQCSITLKDIWPGALSTVLQQRGVEFDASSVVVTDRTGVVLRDVQRSDRMPSHDSFPLRAHYRTVQDKLAAGQAAKFGGAIDVDLNGILASIVQCKFRQLGFDTDDESLRRHGVLLTDATGVDVPLFGPPPERSRFPLKMYFETAAFDHLQLGKQNKHRASKISSGSVQNIRSGFAQKAKTFKRSSSSLAASFIKLATPQRCIDIGGQ